MGTLREHAQRVFDRVLDASVIGSFDRSGFERHRRQFLDGDLRVNLAGRTYLVSGASSGIGRAIAAGLARLGADVVMLCRDEGRGSAAADGIRALRPPGSVRLELVDIASQRKVRALARRLEGIHLHGLIHNAGLLPHERLESAEGHELTWATHVLGPHLLTALLAPGLVATADARVVWISSGGMYTRPLQLDDVKWRRRPYDGVIAYAETKRAQVVLSGWWAKHLKGSGVTSNCMHPGWVDTPGVARSLPRFHRLMRGRLRAPEQGADTAVWLAACPRIAGASGKLWFDRQQQPEHLLPWTAETESERELLWQLCWHEVGLPVPAEGPVDRLALSQAGRASR
jgi:dehydrogenase/reductase SDR family protein 12